MITLITPLIAGNAVKLILDPPSTALAWRICRNTTDVFTDENSDDLIYEGNDPCFIDFAGLENGTVYYYKAFYFDGTDWDSSFSEQSVTPGAAFVDVSVDPLTLVRDRLDKGLNALIAENLLTHPNGTMPVLTASPQIEDVAMPVVTVHLASDRSDERSIGDLIENYTDFNPDKTGWYSAVNLEIVGWCLNGDERKDLRAAIKQVLIANLEIFNAAGIFQITLNFSDSEDFETYKCAIYRTHVSFQCTVISGVQSTLFYPTASSITFDMSTLYG